MPRPKPKNPRRQWAVQFRLPDEVESAIKALASEIDQSDAETCRRLVVLAICDMDARYYPLIVELAGTMGGGNTFVRAAVMLQTSLQAAARVKPELATDDRARARFLGDVVRDELSKRELKLSCKGPWN